MQILLYKEYSKWIFLYMSMCVCVCDVSLVHECSGQIHKKIPYNGYLWGRKVDWGKGFKGNFAIICNALIFLQRECICILFVHLSCTRIFPKASINLNIRSSYQEMGQVFLWFKPLPFELQPVVAEIGPDSPLLTTFVIKGSVVLKLLKQPSFIFKRPGCTFLDTESGC